MPYVTLGRRESGTCLLREMPALRPALRVRERCKEKEHAVLYDVISVRRWRAVFVALLFIGGVLAYTALSYGPQQASAAVGAPASVSVTWGDSTALVRWGAVPGATEYAVTLIRVRDQGIMEQFRVPSSQFAADAQGIWPGERYTVAVQALSGSALGPAALSAIGQAVPIDRSQYNGFLDTENRTMGSLDNNLFDVSLNDFKGGVFVNDQLHYHLTAGSPGNPDFHDAISLRARAPLDWSGGRTAHLHGEVDFKGTNDSWFGVSLSPQAIGTDRMITLEGSNSSRPKQNARYMPQLTIINNDDGIHLFYAAGDGSIATSLGTEYHNPTNLNNVRDTLDWFVSTTHVKVLINGATAFDVALPQSLAFTRGYMTLFAIENRDPHYLRSCDTFGAQCDLWHLDNWGFDANPSTNPAGTSMPTLSAAWADTCGPYPGTGMVGMPGMSGAATGHLCGRTTLTSLGQTANATVHLTPGQISNLASAAVAFDASKNLVQGHLEVKVNQGPFQTPAYVTGGNGDASYLPYVVGINPALLVAGANTVTVREATTGGAIDVANVQIETVSRTAFVVPPLPSQPAALGTWGGGSPPPATPTPTATATASATPTATPTGTPGGTPIDNVPCVILVQGKLQNGTCTGTFVPTKP